MQSGVSFMQSGLALLGELSDSDIDWLLTTGEHRKVPAGDVVVTEGTKLDSVYLVMEGLLNVFLQALGGKKLATLGPGQIFGEMSFLEDRPATASIRTVEDSEILVIPRPDLETKVATDDAFSSRLYRSLALVTSRRLRELVGTLGRWMEDQPPASPETMQRWQGIADATHRFKTLLRSADKLTELQPEVARQIAAEFRSFCEFLHRAIGDASEETIDGREELGARIQREILPYLLKSAVIERFYSKPRGYAGDFLSTSILYRGQSISSGLGRILDRCFFDLPAIATIRSRRDCLTSQICETVLQKTETALVTVLCSGPGDEVFEAFAQLPDATKLKVTFIDFDAQALDALAAKREQAGLQAQIEFVNANLFHLATGRESAPIPPQDLVYCFHLADHFSDKLLLKLLNFLHRLLKPNGRVLVSSYHRDNPNKALMDYLLDWKLTHRSGTEFRTLFNQSSFRQGGSEIAVEPEGVLFLAQCQKA